MLLIDCETSGIFGNPSFDHFCWPKMGDAWDFVLTHGSPPPCCGSEPQQQQLDLNTLSELTTRLTENYSNYHRFHPSVRILFSIAVIFTICIVLLSDTTPSILEEDSSSGESSWWLGNAWELGFSGMKAQRLADASVVHSSSVWKLHGSSKEEKVDKGPTPPDGCESTVTC